MSIMIRCILRIEDGERGHKISSCSGYAGELWHSWTVRHAGNYEADALWVQRPVRSLDGQSGVKQVPPTRMLNAAWVNGELATWLQSDNPEIGSVKRSNESPDDYASSAAVNTGGGVFA